MTPAQSKAINDRHREIEDTAVFEKVMSEAEILGASSYAALRIATHTRAWREKVHSAELGKAVKLCEDVGIAVPPTLADECALMAQKLAYGMVPTTLVKVDKAEALSHALWIMANIRQVSDDAPSIPRASEIAAIFLASAYPANERYSADTLFDRYKKQSRSLEGFVKRGWARNPEVEDGWSEFIDRMETIEGSQL